MNTKKQSIQATAALIIGVVFVVIAGLIFATTTWHTLPNFSKVIMVLGFSGLFFLISELAWKMFKIEKTSQAFYVLGSVFLFITVLAAGYFRLFGVGFTMDEMCRFRVLCAGSIVTELALISGVKRFADRIYTKACFLGLSVIVYFFARALDLGMLTGINAMVIYSVGLVVLDVLTEKRRETMPKYMKAGFSRFARLHFLVFSAILASWVALEFHVRIIQFVLIGEITVLLSTVMAVGAMTAGLTVIALKEQKLYLNILRSISAVVFVHYFGMRFGIGFIYQVFIGALLTGILFFAEKPEKNPVSSEGGNLIHTIVLMMDTVLIMSYAFTEGNTAGTLLAASAAIVLVAAAAVKWGKKYWIIRYFVPVLLYPITISVTGLIHHAGFTGVSHELVVLLFMAAVCAWDLKRKDCFAISILLMGTIGELNFGGMDGTLPLFAICLAVYLLIKSYMIEGKRKEYYEKAGCLYLLMGTFFFANHIFADHFVSFLCTTAVYVVEYILFYCRRKEENDNLFWLVVGLLFFLCDTTSFYLDPGLSAVYIIPCLAIFVAFYIIFYKSGTTWMHLMAAVWIMPMPLMAGYRYAADVNQIYGFTTIAILFIGHPIRSFRVIPNISQRPYKQHCRN